VGIAVSGTVAVMRTFVLIHGMGRAGWCSQPIAERLDEQVRGRPV